MDEVTKQPAPQRVSVARSAVVLESVLTFLLTLAFTLRGCVSLKACDNYCTTEIEILSILYIIPLFVCVHVSIDAQQS